MDRRRPEYRQPTARKLDPELFLDQGMVKACGCECRTLKTLKTSKLKHPDDQMFFFFLMFTFQKSSWKNGWVDTPKVESTLELSMLGSCFQCFEVQYYFEDNGVKTAVSTHMAHFSPLSSRRL